MTKPNTKTRILDTAERLFAEQGFGATSLRTITNEAGVNLASVNYHFGSKEALQIAVLKRCIGPVNKQRLAELDVVEADAGDGPVAVEKILKALLGPPFLMEEYQGKRGEHLLQIGGRLHVEQNEQRQGLLEQMFSEVRERFVRAFSQAIPELSPEEIFWRMHFVIGSMVHTLVWCRNISDTEFFPFPSPEKEALLEKLVHFSTAAMKSPISRQGRKR